MKVLGIIPARYYSSRFQGEPLADILGRSMVQRVYEQCLKSTTLTTVVVATDSEQIYNHVKKFNGNVMMSSDSHSSGTERCNEIIEKIKDPYDLIINIQGDQPYINPIQIDEIVKIFSNKKIEIATLAKKITNKEDLKNPNVVKILFNEQYEAINFCRKTIEERYHFKHIGIYGYTPKALQKICRLKIIKKEKQEKLEQLRWLENKYKIHVGITNYESISVDCPEDVMKIKAQMI